MKQTTYTTRVLEASEGFTLTQSAEVPVSERALCKKVYLSVNASPEDWQEISDERAREIKAEQDRLAEELEAKQ